METKKKLGIICRTKENFESMKIKYSIFFEYYEVIWIPLDKLKTGYEIDKITFDELPGNTYEDNIESILIPKYPKNFT